MNKKLKNKWKEYGKIKGKKMKKKYEWNNKMNFKSQLVKVKYQQKKTQFFVDLKFSTFITIENKSGKKKKSQFFKCKWFCSGKQHYYES